MNDTIVEYIWFGITILGIMLGLSSVFSLFFSDSSVISKMLSIVLEGLM